MIDLVDDGARFRAYRPQYFLPSIVFSIFINATSTYGPLFAKIEQVKAMGSHLLHLVTNT
jgi:hypothetical protein